MIRALPVKMKKCGQVICSRFLEMFAQYLVFKCLKFIRQMIEKDGRATVCARFFVFCAARFFAGMGRGLVGLVWFAQLLSGRMSGCACLPRLHSVT